MARLKKLSRDLNVAILLVHHTNKPTATNTGDIFHSINGSTALMGAVDTTILLQKDRDNPIATFHVTGREVEAKKIWASFKDGKWSAATPDAGKALEKEVDMSSAEAQEAYRNSPLASFIRREAVSSGVKKSYKQLKESHPSLKLRDTWMIKKDIEALLPFFSQDRICIRVGVSCSGNQKGIFIQATIPPNAVQTTMATP